MTVRAPIFLENDTTNQTANILRLLIKDVFGGRGGVAGVNDLVVSQRGAGANMSVDVSSGTSVNLGTEGSSPGSYVVHNDATINVVITASNPTNPRNDLIISKIRDTFYSGASNDAQIIAVAGTPAASPVDPDLDALGHENYQRLARVVVPANATSIVNGNIADLRPRVVAAGGVNTFSSATTRDAAITVPHEGQYAHLADTNRLTHYNGSGWVPSNNNILVRQAITSNSAVFSVSTTTDFLLNSVVVRSDRLYRVHLHSEWQVSAGAVWDVVLRVDTVTTDTFRTINTAGAVLSETMESIILWEPSSGTKTLDVRAVFVSGGTLQFRGSATAVRRFWVEDIGPR